MDDYGATLSNIQASINDMENQVGHLARVITEQPQGSLLRNTKANLREHLKAILLRSGKTIETRTDQSPSVEMKRAVVQEGPSALEEPIEEDDQKGEEESKGPSQARPRVQEYIHRVPYTSRLKDDKKYVQFKKFMSIFKQLHTNIPIIEALSQMFKYAKFLKELLTNKRKLEDVDTVVLNGNCFAILDRKLPTKLRDPRSFVIPCLLGDGVEEHVLVVFEASINVMPYTIYIKFRLGELRPTRMTLQLVDRSVKKPQGIVEDVL